MKAIDNLHDWLVMLVGSTPECGSLYGYISDSNDDIKGMIIFYDSQLDWLEQSGPIGKIIANKLRNLSLHEARAYGGNVFRPEQLWQICHDIEVVRARITAFAFEIGWRAEDQHGKPMVSLSRWHYIDYAEYDLWMKHVEEAGFTILLQQMKDYLMEHRTQDGEASGFWVEAHFIGMLRRIRPLGKPATAFVLLEDVYIHNRNNGQLVIGGSDVERFRSSGKEGEYLLNELRPFTDGGVGNQFVIALDQIDKLSCKLLSREFR